MVIDDANIATKKWGSINCRVFDSLALGIDVITNGKVGAAELFGDRLETYDSEESLTASIIVLKVGNQIPQVTSRYILNNHTYDNRAEQIWSDINETLSSKHNRIHTSIPKPSYSLQWETYI